MTYLAAATWQMFNYDEFVADGWSVVLGVVLQGVVMKGNVVLY